MMEYNSVLTSQSLLDISNAQRISIFFLITTVFFAVYFMFYIYSHAKKDGILYSFLLLNLLMLIWCTGLILQTFCFDSRSFPAWVSLWISYLGLCFFAYAWLVFCVFYTDSKIKKNKLSLTLLALPFVIFYLFLLTNNFHQLFYVLPVHKRRYFGPVYYIFVLTALIYIFYGTCILLRFCFKSKGLSKSQTLIVLFTFVFMLGMLIFRTVLKWDVETIPFTFLLISYAIFYAGFKKFSLFKVVPVSMLSFLDSMEQGILVIDSELDILSSNKALIKMFPCLETIPAGGNIASFLDYLYSSSEINKESLAILDSIRSGKSNAIEGKITLSSQYTRTFSIIVQPFCISRHKEKGRIITFNDISELAELNYQLKQKNKEILSMNKDYKQISRKIMQYTSDKQELSAAKERNRIWNELYGSIESEFSSIITFTHLCINDLSTSDRRNQEKLEELNKMIKNGLQTIRSSIYTQNSKETSNSIKQDIESILLTFNKGKIDIHLIVEGEIQSMEFPIRSAIFGIWQETFENSIKHGKASSIYVIINLKDDFLHLYILDNGKGCENANKGSGLRKMEKMIKNLKGTITYGSLGPDEGFSINAVIPLRLG